MERDGTLTNASKSAKSVQQLNLTELEKKLTPIIENVIRKVLDEKLGFTGKNVYEQVKAML